uniref:Uncharacterized protein n=1 Tax=Rhizophora mucronata TaxID=61149 RepID=A0A2P2PN89_RHIMU
MSTSMSFHSFPPSIESSFNTLPIFSGSTSTRNTL